MSNLTNAEVIAKEILNRPQVFAKRADDFPYCLLDALDKEDHEDKCKTFPTCADCVTAWLSAESDVPNPWDEILIY